MADSVTARGPRPALQLEWRHTYDFQHLMARRVENIILVSSTYDTFILQEDGQLNEVLLNEFLDLNLHHTTGLRHVATGAEAIALATAASTSSSRLSTWATWTRPNWPRRSRTPASTSR